jgi:hypothetical protein
MRRAAIALLLVTAAGASCFVRADAQSQSRPHRAADMDRLGMTCRQILEMSSSDWIAKFVSANPSARASAATSSAANASAQDAQLRAIRVYGECYDDRTNRLAASLGRSGTGPLMGARGDFRDFENALKDYTAKALSATNPPANAAKTALAGLYEKQFRYAFYQAYEGKTPNALSRSPHSGAAKVSSASGASSAALSPSQPSTSAPSQRPEPGNASQPAANSSDPLARAKNRFGELLGALPEDQIHEVHAAFESVMVAHAVDSATELAVYRYAIFVLEPPSPPANSAPAHHGPPNPFSPPPF